jgi:hypothetical protein
MTRQFATFLGMGLSHHVSRSEEPAIQQKIFPLGLTRPHDRLLHPADNIYTQGESAVSVFYIQSGKIKKTVVSEQ